MECADFRFDPGQVCTHEFCWLCFASYSGPTGNHNIGNSAHQAACTHFRANPPVAPAIATREENVRVQTERDAQHQAFLQQLRQDRDRLQARVQAQVAQHQADELAHAQRRATRDARIQAQHQADELANAQRRATHNARITEEEAHAFAEAHTHTRGPPVRHAHAPPVVGSRSRGRLRDPSID
jgi:TolA-binding protein